MTAIAKALIAALGAAALTANAVARAHGWGHVDWTPIAIAWSVPVSVYAYPNVSKSTGQPPQA